MSDAHKSTRLGDLLVERGTITRTQLKSAIDLQQDRRLLEIQTGITTTAKTEIGEILIELGFITRHQLKSGLGWQQRLRRTSFAMAFVAPLLTAACGGGAAGSNNTSNENTQSQSVSSQPVNTTKPDGQSSSSTSSLSSVSSVVSSTPVSSSSSSVPASSAPASSSASSAPIFSSSSVSSSSAPASSSVSSSSSSVPVSSSSSSAASSEAIDGPVVIYWSVPTHRENGDYLDITEIGGYELRYKLKSSPSYTTVDIDSGYTDTYYFDYLEGDFEFELATYDTDGLYSEFVKVRPQ